MSNEIKYRHPKEPSLTWSGRGRQPKWIEAFLQNAGTLDDLLVAPSADGDDEIDLDITGSAAVTPTLAEQLYANRIVMGQSPVPDGKVLADPAMRAAIAAATEVRNQNSRLASLAEQGNARPVGNEEAGQQQLEVCLREFGFGAMTADEFLQVGIDELNQSVIRACRAGTAFWAAQQALLSTDSAAGGVVNFKQWIGQVGLTEQRVYECIKIAKFYARLPNDKRTQLLNMSKKPALLLASLPQDVIDRAAESGNDLLEKADLMTVSELREELRMMQRREKNYDAEFERMTLKVQKLSQDKVRTTSLLLRTEELREECMALQLTAELPLNALRKLFDETEQTAAEGKLQTDHLWIVANAVAARALDLVEYIRARALDALPDRPFGEHLLSPAEAERWLLDYPLIENRFEAERAIRQEKRDQAKPRGPGRPKSSGKSGD